MEIVVIVDFYCPIPKNITCSKVYSSFAANLALLVVFVTGIILAVCGNLALIISVLHFKQLYTPSNVLILSMAFADFIIGIFSMPVHFLQTTEVCCFKSAVFCFAHLLTYTSLTNISVLHLLFLACDRYYSVCYPLFYSTKVTFKVIWMLVVTVWSGSVIYVFVSSYIMFYVNFIAAVTEYEGNALYILPFLDSSVTFILPFLITFCLYAKIFIVAKRHAKTVQCVVRKGDSEERTRTKGLQKTQLKAAKTISIVICVFICSWLPAYIYALLGFVSSTQINYFLLELGFYNSAFNPMIYGFFYPWFWKAFKIIITFKIFRPESSCTNLFSNH